MSRRRISKFSVERDVAEGHLAYGALEPLTAAQQAYLLYAAQSAVSEISIEVFEAIEAVRREFYRVAQRSLVPHRDVHRRLRRCQSALTVLTEELETFDHRGALVWGALAARAGADLVQILACLPWFRAMERAARDCVGRHQRPIVDAATPFEGLVCELAWIWRRRLLADLTISNRPPLTSFTRFAFAVMRTLPREVQMHTGNVDPSDDDSFSGFTQALWRAERATREFQGDLPMTRRLAWCLVT